ncbi:hypothetical protein O3M35_000161 [Rhynocoris fuscipes]|uniref:BZIP domain-containing protein n=1 Tax=Rhynocoris fuscipes TaxID=488301 RepID=A0AAW1DLN4_9HEMI
MDSLRGFICEDYDSTAESEYEGNEYSVSSHQKSYLPSETYRSKKVKCLSRNAVMARENRRRKKLYIESIEKEAKYLRETNRRLEIENKKNSKDMVSLRKEVNYLRNVMSNSSSIEKLLKAINKALNPSVIVKTENSAVEPRATLSAPLFGDPLLSSSSSTVNTEFPSTQTLQSNHEDVPDLREEDLPQSLEEKKLLRRPAHFTKDSKGAVIFSFF